METTEPGGSGFPLPRQRQSAARFSLLAAFLGLSLMTAEGLPLWVTPKIGPVVQNLLGMIAKGLHLWVTPKIGPVS